MSDTYLKLNDNLPEHRKIVDAGGDAGWLHVCALAYSSRNLSDGIIPSAMVPRLSDRKQPAKLAARLVEVRLWHKAGHDCARCPQPAVSEFVIHDYLEHQRSAARVDEIKSKRAVAGRRGGTRKAANAKAATQKPKQASSNLLGPNSAPAAANEVTDESTPTGNNDSARLRLVADATREAEPENDVKPACDAAGPSNLVGGWQQSALTNGTPDTEEVLRTSRTEEPLRGSQTEQDAPPSAGEAEPRRDEVTARTIVGEWIDRCRERPPSNVIGQISRQIKTLLDDGIDPYYIRSGMREWMTKDVHPSVLPSLVNNVMNGLSGGRGSTTQAARSTTDDRVAQAQSLKEKFRIQAPPTIQGEISK